MHCFLPRHKTALSNKLPFFFFTQRYGVRLQFHNIVPIRLNLSYVKKLYKIINGLLGGFRQLVKQLNHFIFVDCHTDHASIQESFIKQSMTNPVVQWKLLHLTYRKDVITSTWTPHTVLA